MMHINCLELLAGAFAVNTLVKSSKDDNTTAVSYIDKMEGRHSHTLAKMACSLWQWCLGIKGNCAVSRASARITEHDCREGILDFSLFSRVATTQDGVPKF